MRKQQARRMTARRSRAPLALLGLALAVVVGVLYAFGIGPFAPGPTPLVVGPGSPTPGATPTPAPSSVPSSPPPASPSPSASATAASPTATDPSAGVEATQGTQSYQFKSALDFRSGRLDTSQTLTWTNRGDTAVNFINLSVLPRAIDMLTDLGPVTVDGVAAATDWTTTTNLRVTFPAPIDAGQTATIGLDFSLTIDRSQGNFRERLAKRGGVIYAGGWFPIWSREHDSYGIGDPQVSYNADSVRFELSATRALGTDAVVATGERIAAADNAWMFEARNVRDFAFVVNPKADRATTTVSCREGGQAHTAEIIVVTYIAPARTVASNVAAAMRRFNDLYGCYPWPTLSVAEVDYGEGMEYPQLVFIGKDWITSSRYITYHEVAHQWWYAQVGNDQLLEPWIDEAWAQFSTNYALNVRFNSCSRQPVNHDVFHWKGSLRGGNWFGAQGYVETVYFRGAQFLNELRKRMGDAAFFRAARKVVAGYRYEVITGEELLDVFRDSTSANLEPIIDRYFSVGPRVPGSYGTGRGSSNHCSGAPGGY